MLDILHRADVNIASMSVARPESAAAHSKALTFMALDDEIGDNAMKLLRSLDFLQHVSKIQLQ